MHREGSLDCSLFCDQTVQLVFALGIFDSHSLYPLFEFRSVHDQARDHFPMKAAHGGGGDHAFRGSANSHNGVDARASNGGLNGWSTCVWIVSGPVRITL